MEHYKPKHDIEFEAADWHNGWKVFRIGTCHGAWRSTYTSYEILAVNNEVKGNGHFDDVLGYFEHSCVRDQKNLVILEIWNKALMQHLITKRGFEQQGDNAIKRILK